MMKKLITILTVLIFSAGALNAQIFSKGSQVINAGIGFGHTYLGGVGYSIGLPAITASYEHGVVDIPISSDLDGAISVGGFLGYANSSYRYSFWSDDLKYVYNSFLISARGNFHFVFHEKFDPYAGIHLGFLLVNGKWKGDGAPPGVWDAQSSRFSGGGYVGGRYYFSDAIAVYSELGWMLAYFHVGVSFKLN